MQLFHAIDHIGIIVSDYQKARAFYVDTLGFQIVRENYREEQQDWKLDLCSGNCRLEIFGKSDAPARQRQPETCGYRHLSFHVDNVVDMVKKLEARGVACTPIRRDAYTNNNLAFFKDPEGNVLELHE